MNQATATNKQNLCGSWDLKPVLVLDLWMVHETEADVDSHPCLLMRLLKPWRSVSLSTSLKSFTMQWHALYHGTMMTPISLSCVSLHMDRYVWACSKAQRPKVDVGKYPQSLFHLIHWNRVSQSNVETLMWFIWIASFLWGSCLPSKAWITCGLPSHKHTTFIGTWESECWSSCFGGRWFNHWAISTAPVALIYNLASHVLFKDTFPPHLNNLWNWDVSSNQR